jgi:energy-coupling factor transporter ATP-binding protein EcfA2
MKYLESINLVQFFLYEREHVRISEITGIFGPNGSGKSSFLDAVQIAMFGANSRLMALNAQADENKTTRSIRSYCLGQYGDTAEDRVRPRSNTYITLVWRDSETKKPVSMGVCIYADENSEQHKVLGRYLLPDVELTLGDHLETVDGKESPREWSTFKQQLLQRSKVSGEECVFEEAERYIRACLLELRGSGGAPSYDAFVRAFRFALRMRFDKTVDEIVRNDVLESRPTNIKRFKEVTDSFRRLAELVAQVEQKIIDGGTVETAFNNATIASSKAATWKALGLDVALEQANQAHDEAQAVRNSAEEALKQADDAFEKLKTEHAEAAEKTRYFRGLREQHASHADYAGLHSQIRTNRENAKQKRNDIIRQLSLFRECLKKAAATGILEEDVSRNLVAESQKLAVLTERFDETEWNEVEAHLRTAIQAAELAQQKLIAIGNTLSDQQKTANENLKNAQGSLERASQGKAPLNPNVETLMRELRDEGISPVVACDVVRITKKEWQPAIETYLGGNLQALLVAQNQERQAFEVYRGLPGKRAVYGAKIVMESRQETGRRYESGSVAELVEGTDPAAVAFLRGLLGDMVCATTTAQAMERGKRTLTQDGMLVGKGTIERLKLVADGDLRIGRDGGGRHLEAAKKHVVDCTKAADAIETQVNAVEALSNVLRIFPPEAQAQTFIKGYWTDAEKANDTAASLEKKVEGAANEEYLQLGRDEEDWSKKADKLNTAVTDANGDLGVAKTAFGQCERNVEAAAGKVQVASEAAENARNDPEYNAEYSSRHWDALLEKHGEDYAEMANHCDGKQKEATRRAESEANKGSSLMGEFLSKYREQASEEVLEDWRKGQAWMGDILKRLRDTELLEFKAQMNDAYKVSQDTFRNDVALALSQNIEALDVTMDQLNRVLKECPAFTNGERYQFKRVVRPHFKPLLEFVKNIASFGPQEDLLGGAGEIPPQFKELLEDKIAPGAGSVKSPLDDYREFYEFDVEILREDLLTEKQKVVGHLSKRIGPGSGGEHRAPLYVIAGAALASAYRLDRGNRDGIRLILLDEAFNKMDPTNITATMRYLQDLGLQVFMASPGENLGVLNAFLHRYYDISKDSLRSVIFIDGHDVTDEVREMFMSDDLDTHPELIEQEVNRMHGAEAAVVQTV